MLFDNEDLGKSFYKVLIDGYKGIKLIDFSGVNNTYNCVTELTYKNGENKTAMKLIVTKK